MSCLRSTKSSPTTRDERPGTMNLQLVSEILFSLGRRFPRLPFAFLRAMPLGLLHALRAPGLRETIRVATRASYYRDAFAAMRVDVASARRPEDLGDFYLTPGILKTRPEALVTGPAELAIESSGTTGHATRVYLSRRELEYTARQGGLLYGLYGLGRGDRLLCTLDLAWGLGSLLVERGVRYTPLFAMVVGRVDPLEAYRRLAEYRFNVVVSDPFWLVRLTAIARERGRPGPMKLLMGGGEGITPRTRAELEAFWGAALCMTYASTEVDGHSWTCSGRSSALSQRHGVPTASGWSTSSSPSSRRARFDSRASCSDSWTSAGPARLGGSSMRSQPYTRDEVPAPLLARDQ